MHENFRRTRQHYRFRRKNRFWKWRIFLVMFAVVIGLVYYYMIESSEQQSKPTAEPNIPQNQMPDNTSANTTNTQACANPPLGTKIEVDISEQKLYLICRYENSEEVKTYPVSTSKYGIGSQAGSNKTPLGRHRIENKMGDRAPEGMIFKARQPTGQIAQMNVEGAGDLVTTRIMWLKGLEPGENSGRGIDSYRRYIYIHGTAEEKKIGQPASHGCVRMYNRDVIDLFDRVTEGAEVYIKE